MLIKTSIRAAKVDSKSLKDVREFVAGDHDIAWSNDLNDDSSNGIISSGYHMTNSLGLTAVSLDEINKKSRLQPSKDLNLEYLNLGKQATSLVGQCFPEALEQPIQGVELVIASAVAFEEWSDKKRTSNVQASLATGKALIKAIDFLTPYVPILNQVQPYSKVAGVILSTVESAYVVYTNP
ncbi:MAG: hypothetical protein ACPGJI_01095 [Kangiellaceae bacterium]